MSLIGTKNSTQSSPSTPDYFQNNKKSNLYNSYFVFSKYILILNLVSNSNYSLSYNHLHNFSSRTVRIVLRFIIFNNYIKIIIMFLDPGIFW